MFVVRTYIYRGNVFHYIEESTENMETGQQEFAGLYARFKAGDSSAFEQFVPLLEPIVKSAVRKFLGRGRSNYPIEDFIQEGWDAVFIALCTYDVERYPTLVRSYFYNAIIARLVSVNNQIYMVTLPRALKRFMRDVNLGRVDWSLSDEALHVSYPLVNIDDITALRRQEDAGVYDVVLMEGDLLDSHGLPSAVRTTGHSRIERADISPTEERLVDRMAAQDVLFWFLGRLTEREYQVFVLRFVDEKSKTAIAKELGCSVATIDRIEKSILNKR